MSSPLDDAEQAALEALMERHPGEVSIEGIPYQVALVETRASDIISEGGIMARKAITVSVPRCVLTAAPAPGVMVEDLADSERYEIISTRRDSAAWFIRAAIFP